MASFQKALDAGATGLEFDVRRSADGALVVIHDETVDRTTNGRGLVRDLSYEQLRRLDAGSGESIPLLSTVLERFGRRCLLNIELKDSGISADVKSIVAQFNLAGDVIVSSFDWRELRPLAPEIPIGLLASSTSGLVRAAIDMKATAIHPKKGIVTEALVAAAHDANLKVYVWTVNDLRERRRLQALAVDGIFTDFPSDLTRM